MQVVDMTVKLSKLAPIRREGIADLVVKQIIGLIESGGLRSGDRLPPERKMAEELGIGRPTLREALRALSLLGILDIRHGGGVYVSSLSAESLLGPLHTYIGVNSMTMAAITEARTIIEGAIVAHVAKRIEDSHLADLRSTVDKMQELVAPGRNLPGKTAQFQSLAQEFRSILKIATNNAVLARTVEGLDTLSAAARRSLRDDDDVLQELCLNHGRIVAALAAHDENAARQAVNAHLSYLQSIYIDNKPDPGGQP